MAFLAPPPSSHSGTAWFLRILPTRLIVSRKALRGLIAGYLTPEVRHGTVSGGMAFFLAVDYGIAGTFGVVRIFKFLPVNLHVDALLFALLPDIPEELCEGYIVVLYFDRIVCHCVGLLKNMFYFCE